MKNRIQKELDLLRQRYRNLEYIEEGRWIRIPDYPLCKGWNRTSTDVAVQIGVGHPGAAPYGIHTPSGLLHEGSRPDNYTDPATNRPPFSGQWAFFSWSPKDGQWRATADLVSGSNLLNWVMSFSDRFKEGK